MEKFEEVSTGFKYMFVCVYRCVCVWIPGHAEMQDLHGTVPFILRGTAIVAVTHIMPKFGIELEGKEP